MFIVIKIRTGDTITLGQPGAYQNPISSPNIWRDFEFPMLPANDAVMKVTTVDISNNYQTTTDWTRSHSNPILPPSVLNVPLATPVKMKRDGTIDTASISSDIARLLSEPLVHIHQPDSRHHPLPRDL